METLLNSLAAQQRPKDLAAEAVRKLREAWKQGGGTQRRIDRELDDAESILFFCFMTQGAEPLQAKARTDEWSGPGDPSKSAEVSERWEALSIRELIVRTQEEVEKSGGTPPDFIQAAVNRLYGCFVLAKMAVPNAKAEAERVVQEAAVRGMVRRDRW